MVLLLQIFYAMLVLACKTNDSIFKGHLSLKPLLRMERIGDVWESVPFKNKELECHLTGRCNRRSYIFTFRKEL